MWVLPWESLWKIRILCIITCRSGTQWTRVVSVKFLLFASMHCSLYDYAIDIALIAIPCVSLIINSLPLQFQAWTNIHLLTIQSSPLALSEAWEIYEGGSVFFTIVVYRLTETAHWAFIAVKTCIFEATSVIKQGFKHSIQYLEYAQSISMEHSCFYPDYPTNNLDNLITYNHKLEYRYNFLSREQTISLHFSGFSVHIYLLTHIPYAGKFSVKCVKPFYDDWIFLSFVTSPKIFYYAFNIT